MLRCEILSQLVCFCVHTAVRGRGDTSGWKRGPATWTSSKRISFLFPLIRSELNTQTRVQTYFLCHASRWHVILLRCLFRAHWYLVVICFPGLDEPRVENLICPDSQAAKCNSGTSEIQDQDVAQRSKNSNGVAEIRLTLNHADNTHTETGGFVKKRVLSFNFYACF